jgi:hypothetical protein
MVLCTTLARYCQNSALLAAIAGREDAHWIAELLADHEENLPTGTLAVDGKFGVEKGKLAD